MAIVTIDGHIGAGAPEVGKRVSKMLSLDYHDRLLLAGVAKRLGATVEAVYEKERRVHRLSDRVWNFIERALSGMAVSGMAGEPYYGASQPGLMPLTWDEGPDGPRTSPIELQNSEVAQAISDQVRAVADIGNAVIVHRAGCVELKDAPHTLRVGLFAPWEHRVERVMRREGHIRPEDAEEAIRERERAQMAYFKEFHSADPHDRSLYDLSLDTSSFNLDVAALKVARAVRSIIGPNERVEMVTA